MESLKKILSRNPYLDANVGLGYQNFLDFVCGKQFYVDKKHFIPEWLASDARITLITRPRRFGKSMLLSTVRTFFDPMYADHPEYFKKLQVWKDKDCRRLFGTIPVISVSFGSCKGNHFEQAMRGVTLASGQKIVPENTLIIFDEVQDCPKVINSMKYFCENAPQYHIACAGSLLGIALAKSASFPVGKVEFHAD